MDNSTNNLDTVSSISPEALKNTIKIQKQSILLTKKSLRVQEDNLTNNINMLQNICSHDFKIERTTTGPYAEYYNICQHCNKHVLY